MRSTGYWFVLFVIAGAVTSAELRADLRAGFSAVDITPSFEGRPLPVGRATLGYRKGDPFFDSGMDGLFDFEEPSAFGADGKPGREGIDDDGNGSIDDCDRAKCAEYLSLGSDDLRDPHHDNHDKKRNPKGTEGDRKFQHMPLGGFGLYYPPAIVATRIATGVHDRIWARGIALSSGNSDAGRVPLLLISTDLPGLAWKHINPVKRRLEKEFGIPFSNIVIASTHNHAGPDASGYWVTLLKGHNRSYTNRLREWMYEAGRDALLSMRTARMKTITTNHVACIDAVTGALKRDPDCRIPPNGYEYDRAGGKKWDVQAVQHDKRDPMVRNTRIVAAQFIEAGGRNDGRTLGTFLNWHNHPDSLTSDNMLISSDFIHYLRAFVENELGGTAVYFSGTVGCQIGSSPGVPVPLWTEDFKPVYKADGRRDLIATNSWDRIRSIGFEVGHEAVVALEAAVALDRADIEVKTESIDTRINNFLHTMGTASVWRFDVEKPDRMKRYPRGCTGKYGCVRSELSVIQIGELGIVTAPGEIDPSYMLGRERTTADYGKKHGKVVYPAMPAWDRYMPGRHHAVLGQANNYLSYLIHRSDNVGWWNFGHPNHYEDFVTVSRDFGDDTGNHLMRMLGSTDVFTP